MSKDDDKTTNYAGTPEAHSFRFGGCGHCNGIHLLLLREDGTYLAAAQLSPEHVDRIYELSLDLRLRFNPPSKTH